MKRVVVTGVAGQDGSFLAEQLLARGDRVIGITLRADPNDWWTRTPVSLKAGESGMGLVVLEVDVTDAAAFALIIKQERPHEVFHLAAPSAVDASWESAAQTEAAIAAGTETVLAATAQYTPEAHVVMASSSEVFAPNAPAPQNEHSPMNPASPYGRGKYRALLSARAARDRGFRVSSAILFNHESERRPARFVTRKITLAAARIAAGVQQSVTLGNVESRRDWGYAGDYMNALVRMATLESPQDFVIGTGVAHSVRDLAALAFSEVGLNYLDHVETDDALTRPVDAPLRLADASAARRVLSWTPSLTFEDLIRRMVAADVARVRAGQDEGDAP